MIYLITAICSIVCAIFSVLSLLIYVILLRFRKTHHAKYEFIAKYEIKSVWISCVLLIMTVGFAAAFQQLDLDNTVMYMGLFIIFSLGLILGLIVRYALNIYYTQFMEKRLLKLRHMPRISPRTGKLMKLLTEEKEDIHLDEGMRAEEKVFSMDYDVWIDEETGFIQIEKYSGKHRVAECPNCKYRTFKLVKEEVFREPTEERDGELIQYYECNYCRKRNRKLIPIQLNGKKVIAKSSKYEGSSLEKTSAIF